jgi:hypothetical protein
MHYYTGYVEVHGNTDFDLLGLGTGIEQQTLVKKNEIRVL